MNYEADILSSISSIAQLETLSKDNWKVYFKNLYCLENDKLVSLSEIGGNIE